MKRDKQETATNSQKETKRHKPSRKDAIKWKKLKTGKDPWILKSKNSVPDQKGKLKTQLDATAAIGFRRLWMGVVSLRSQGWRTKISIEQRKGTNQTVQRRERDREREKVNYPPKRRKRLCRFWWLFEGIMEWNK